MFSQTAEYALRAVVWLASEFPGPLTSKQVADATRVPAGYLSKVLQELARAQMVRAQRGLHGGFVLSRPPAQITILDVINAVDPPRRILSCPLKLTSHGSMLCPLHRRLDEAAAMTEGILGKTTIAEILAEPSCSKPLCESEGGRGRSRPGT